MLLILTLLVASVSLFSLPKPLVGGKDEDSNRDYLVSMWKAQHSSVVTARFRVRLYRAAWPTRDALLRDLSPFLQSHDLHSLNEAIEVFKQLEKRSLYWDVPLQVLIEGGKLRNDWALQMPQVGPVSQTCIFDGKEEIVYSSMSNQCTLTSGRSVEEKIGLFVLRVLPHINSVDDEPSRFRIGKQTDGVTTVVDAPYEYAVDHSTGFIRKRTTWDKDQRHILREAFQFGPTSFATGSILPTITVHANYDQNDVPYLVTLYHIQHADLNVEIPPESFVLGVPAGTVVVDQRSDPDRPTVVRVSQSVTNVRQYQALPALQAEVESSQPFWGLTKILVLILGLTMVCVGLFIWRRRSLASP